MGSALVSRRGWLAASLGVATGVRAALPDVVAAVRPSVVGIGTYNALESPRFAFRGTGFAVGDGTVIATNLHVVPPADAKPAGALRVLLPRDASGGELRPAQLLASDREHDVALLRIEGAPLPALTLAGPELAREGTAVAFTGFPIGGLFGFSPVTHRGIVSSLTRIALPAPTADRLSARAIAELREGAFPVYQLDATAYPGNSGGPVFDADTGAVLGIINMVLVRGARESALTHPTGISYAIPVRFVRELLERR